MPGNAVASGQALIDALSSISGSGAADRYKVVLGPGVFDVQTTTLNVPTYVTLCGAGRDATQVVSTARRGVTMAHASALRDFAFTQTQGQTGEGIYANGATVALREMDITLNCEDDEGEAVDLVSSVAGLFRVSIRIRDPDGAAGSDEHLRTGSQVGSHAEVLHGHRRARRAGFGRAYRRGLALVEQSELRAAPISVFPVMMIDGMAGDVVRVFDSRLYAGDESIQEEGDGSVPNTLLEAALDGDAITTVHCFDETFTAIP